MTDCREQQLQRDEIEEHYDVARYHIQQKLDQVIDVCYRLARTGQCAFVDPGYRFALKRKVLRKLDRLEDEFEEAQHHYRALQALRAKVEENDGDAK